MILWPHLAVWPFFVLGCAVLGHFNRPAALAFLAYWIGFQVVKFILPDQIAYFVFISLLSAIIFLWVDRMAGTIMAAVGVVYIIHIIGGMPQLPKVLISEALILMGMISSGLHGPSNGLLVGNAGHSGLRHSDTMSRWIVAPKEVDKLD